MPKKHGASDLRKLQDAELVALQQKLAEEIARTSFRRTLGADSALIGALRTLKRDRARALTVLHERQIQATRTLLKIEQARKTSLHASRSQDSPEEASGATTLSFSRQRHLPIPGIERNTKAKERSRHIARHVNDASGGPLISATVLGSEYPLIVGHSYRMLFKRESQEVAAMQRELLGLNLMRVTPKKRRAISNFDVDVAFRSASVRVASTTKVHRIPNRSSLEIEVVPQEPGDHNLEIFVSVPQTKRLLQILQVPLMAVVAGRGLA